MIYVIVNMASKTGMAAKVWMQVRDMLKKSGEEYTAYQTKGKGHATQLAKKITSQDEAEYKMIVVGGDGTINEVLNGIQDFRKVHLGIIPNGSGNDFARGVGIPSDLELNLNNIIHGVNEICIDIGRVRLPDTERYFGISCGVGLDAEVCKKTVDSKQKKLMNKLKKGHLIYLLLTVESLFTMKSTNALITYDDQVVPTSYEKMIFSASMNLSTEGGGVKMAPSSRYNDGRLSMCLAYGLSKAGACLRLPALVVAKHEKLKNFAMRNFKKADIMTEDPVIVHADGEYLGEAKHVQVECMRHAICVFVP